MKSLHRTTLPTSVRILSILAYAGFAISVSITAMVLFGVVGIALPLLFAWQWAHIPALNGQDPSPIRIADLAPDAQPAGPKSSGNASFDAYRESLMNRLEQEQESFERFMSRLRAARDKAEFDEFLDARAQKRIAPPQRDADAQPQPS